MEGADLLSLHSELCFSAQQKTISLNKLFCFFLSNFHFLPHQQVRLSLFQTPVLLVWSLKVKSVQPFILHLVKCSLFTHLQFPVSCFSLFSLQLNKQYIFLLFFFVLSISCCLFSNVVHYVKNEFEALLPTWGCGVDVMWMWCGCGVDVVWMWCGCGFNQTSTSTLPGSFSMNLSMLM